MTCDFYNTMYTDTFFGVIFYFFRYACLAATPGEIISKSGEFKVLIWTPANNKLDRHIIIFTTF